MPDPEFLREVAWWQQAAQEMSADPMKMMPFLFASSQKARQVILDAHRKGSQALKSTPAKFPVGITLALQDIQAGPGGEEKAKQVRYEMDRFLAGSGARRRFSRRPDLFAPPVWTRWPASDGRRRRDHPDGL